MLLDFLEPDNREDVLYRSIYEKIKAAVECGAIKRGEKLPSVREAAAQLSVSRTTVENAYSRLCIEGLAESLPQRGYFVRGVSALPDKTVLPSAEKPTPKYDFSSRSTDSAASDTALWKKLVRSVLWNNEELNSYGDPQGERRLREALAAYSYKARGVRATADNIIIGAGVDPLLHILCSLTGRNCTVGIDGGGFKTAERIFCDYGIETKILPTDSSGATSEGLYESKSDILFLMPSALSKINVNALSKRRGAYADWAESGEHLIIEDDYNGELRYTAHTVPSFQGTLPEKTVYIGSFSKLLLPSVRIAYTVLPQSLCDRFKERLNGYNQTCGKIEQLALAEYIESGALEKHLRRLRRIYYAKSQTLCRELSERLQCIRSLKIFESSLIAVLYTDIDAASEDICAAAERNGIRLMEHKERGAIRLCFAGISEEDIPAAVQSLSAVLKSNFG